MYKTVMVHGGGGGGGDDSGRLSGGGKGRVLRWDDAVV